MSLREMNEIAVAADTSRDIGIMLSAIVKFTFGNVIMRSKCPLLIDMKEPGEELLNAQQALAATYNSTRRSHSYNLEGALKGRDVPDTLHLAVNTKKQKCGRLFFYPIDKIPADAAPDCVLAITSKRPSAALIKKLEGFMKDKDMPLVAAVKCDSSKDLSQTCRDELSKGSAEMGEYLKKRKSFCGWYDPYGFNGSGSRNNAESCAPYGIEELFWKLTAFSAIRRIDDLTIVISEKQREIARFGSVFQKGSVRRTMWLEVCRADYAKAVRDIYSAEQMYALGEDRELAEKE